MNNKILTFDELYKPSVFKEFLKTMATEYHYSLFNQILIFSQFPENSITAGQQAWEKLGAKVNDDAKGITVVKYDKNLQKEKVLVFDKSQTNYDNDKKQDIHIEDKLKESMGYLITYDPTLKEEYCINYENEEIIIKDDNNKLSSMISAFVNFSIDDSNFENKCLIKCLNYCLNYCFGNEIKESFLFVSTINNKKKFLDIIHKEISTALQNIFGFELQMSFEETNLFNLFSIPNKDSFIEKLEQLNDKDGIAIELANKFKLLSDRDYRKLFRQKPLMSYPLPLLNIV